MEAAHGHGAARTPYDRVKQAARMETDRGHALREAILALPARRHRVGHRRLRRADGQVPDRRADEQGADDQDRPVPRAAVPAAAARAHQHGDIDPSFVVTHRLELDEAPDGYETFKHKQDECVKVVLKP